MIVPIKTGNLATKQARQGSIFSSSKRLQVHRRLCGFFAVVAVARAL